MDKNLKCDRKAIEQCFPVALYEFQYFAKSNLRVLLKNELLVKVKVNDKEMTWP